MTRLKTLALLAGALAAATPSAAYYHYVHYLNSPSGYSVAFERFDLAALPDQTVTFFVSDSGPTSYTPNDSFPSVLEQIRNATQVWNSVASSNLRVAFGGLQAAGTQQSVPTGEVVFEELPPGLLAFAGPQATASVAIAPDGTLFVPITLSLIHLNVNMTQQAGPEYIDSYTGPSYAESFFLTLVHEIGHAIGLQHTFTSATMSTAVSRATNRTRPLDADDIAGISLLYPAGGFPAGYGSISGQVNMNGQPVHLASVVAILPNGSAVSSLTNPAGSYEIDGLPPGNYWVYVHPLPPTANIISPVDPNGNDVAQSGAFVSTFYPGAWDPNQFTPIAIAQGASVGGINFTVQPRSAVEVYDVTSYWWTGSTYLQPAFLNANTVTATIPQVVAQGAGITSGATSTNVQSVLALGAPGAWLAEYGLQPYQDVDTTLLEMFFDYPSAPAPGPEHLFFTLPDDIFVLPWGFQVVQNPPPAVTAVTPNPDGSVTVTGTGLNANSQVYFDSLPGQVMVAFAANASDPSGQTGLISVMPPPGASGQTAAITVYNSDGQNSTFLLSPSQNPFTYSYPQSDAPAASIYVATLPQETATLPQGVSAMVDVTTSNMQFVDGLTTLGFGSGDVAVRRLWVLPGAAHAVANVTVSPSAILQNTVASVISGFQVYEQTPGFQVVPANPNLAVINLPVTNFNPLQNSLYSGSTASIYGQNLQAAGIYPAITVAGFPAGILYTTPTQINIVIPVGVPTGPAILTFQGAYPIVLQIDPPPPVIAAAASATGAAQPPAPGDAITLTVSGMYVPPAAPPSASRVAVTEGGVSVPVFTIQQPQDGSSNLQIRFALTASVTGQSVPVTVSLDGDLSMPFYINVAAPTLSGSN
ncbi:MAG TPA: matrixin family metalloprotease [Bryobacteraceae bacterium]|nr:matrixin family metalloprotease [Bryobacteraceae bacterium]